MSLDSRDDEQYELLEKTMEDFFDTVDYQDIEETVLKDMYVEIRSSYNLVREWREDDDVDWVVVDQYLKNAAEKASNFLEAYEP